MTKENIKQDIWPNKKP